MNDIKNMIFRQYLSIIPLVKKWPGNLEKVLLWLQEHAPIFDKGAGAPIDIFLVLVQFFLLFNIQLPATNGKEKRIGPSKRKKKSNNCRIRIKRRGGKLTFGYQRVANPSKGSPLFLNFYVQCK